jgi:hypothetical protein
MSIYKISTMMAMFYFTLIASSVRAADGFNVQASGEESNVEGAAKSCGMICSTCLITGLCWAASIDEDNQCPSGKTCTQTDGTKVGDYCYDSGQTAGGTCK